MPLYTHDCDKCRFLGIDVRRHGEPQCNGVDMYVCESVLGRPLLLRRYSSEGPNYGCLDVEYIHYDNERYGHMIQHARELKWIS